MAAANDRPQLARRRSSSSSGRSDRGSRAWSRATRTSTSSPRRTARASASRRRSRASRRSGSTSSTCRPEPTSGGCASRSRGSSASSRRSRLALADQEHEAADRAEAEAEAEATPASAGDEHRRRRVACVPPTSRDEQRSRLDRELERTLLRTRNGIRLVAGSSGPKIGASPKDVVWRRGRAELWRYHGGAVRYAQPILIVFSLVSRSYILDLRPGHSTVEFLVDRGFDVFLLDWGVPDERDAENSLETYVDTLPAAGGRRRPARDGMRRDHARRLLPRRNARDALRERARRRAACATSCCWPARSTSARWARWWPGCTTGGSRSTT